MYVSAGKMLSDARRGGYAVGAFNFENMEMALAIVSAAEELGRQDRRCRPVHRAIDHKENAELR